MSELKKETTTGKVVQPEPFVPEKSKEWTVYFHGKITVEADSESEATDRAFESLKESGAMYTITEAVEEGEVC
jgi:hypothetical protein